MHEVEVVAGVNDIDDEDNNEVRKRVRVAAYHSEYTATLLFHDIAVLKVGGYKSFERLYEQTHESSMKRLSKIKKSKNLYQKIKKIKLIRGCEVFL